MTKKIIIIFFCISFNFSIQKCVADIVSFIGEEQEETELIQVPLHFPPFTENQNSIQDSFDLNSPLSVSYTHLTLPTKA